MADIFSWINEQLLRMQWLSDLVTLLVNNGLGFHTNSKVGASIHFFINEVTSVPLTLRWVWPDTAQLLQCNFLRKPCNTAASGHGTL